MFPGVNPKQMQGMMKKMGISQEDVPAEKVIIEKTDGSKTIITEPSVQRIKMQGQETFQVAGMIHEEEAQVSISQEDIQAIVEKTGVSEELAKASLEKTGDLAESILELSE
jgi:nascent polypeptide-associated complex subunit alpha